MKKKTAFLLSLLAVLMLWSPCSLQAAIFDDIADSAWYADAVNYCYEKNYFSGMTETRFGPELSMTRAMLVTVLYRHSGSPAVSGGNDFEDVPAVSWYTAAVTWGSDQKIVFGYEDGTFRPEKEVSRQELMAFFRRYAAARGKDVSLSGDDRIFNAFSDKNTVDDWAVDSVRWCTSFGLVCGYNGAISPADTSTRAQIASMMKRLDSYFAGKMCTISASAGSGGSVIPAGSFTIVENSSVCFRAVPSTGYMVDYFAVNGVSKGGGTFCTVPAAGTSQNLTVTFRKFSGNYQSGMAQLVNRTYPIPNASSYSVSDLTSVKYSVSGRDVKLRKEAAQALDQMIAAYRSANPSSPLYAQSGYRSYSYQTTLYKNQVARKGNNIYAAGVVSAIPGTSEHELGLAVDLTYDGTLLQSFGSSRQGKWLAEHCGEYGFILRYPADKQMVTGIIYEPWHFRYVGKAVVSEMKTMGVTTLEEYYGLPLADKDITPYAPYLK
ncbi:MAG: D-alanyl-D-alanine carboxypeptidase family protein [Clostridia bacterium]